MSRILLILLFWLWTFSAGALGLSSSCPADRIVNGEFLVRTKSNSNISQKIITRGFGIQTIQKSSARMISTFHIKNIESDTLADLVSDPSIVSIENNCYIPALSIPNDPDFTKNIAFPLIKMTAAWSVLNSSSIIVAVPDMGIDIEHPELVDNIWENSAEVLGLPGVDDDENGYIDDFNGWAFPENNNDISPGSFPGSEHGTHVAGIIGATGNNGVGTAGVLWAVKLMPLRVFKKSVDETTTADLVSSIYYAVNNGAKVINCSWGAEQTPSPVEMDAYDYAESKGVFVVAAGGNAAKNVQFYSPASLPNVFAVGSINSVFELSTFSSFGNKIGVLAPGGDVQSGFGFGIDEAIFSTFPNSAYGYRKGTSISAPFVSGVAAIIKTLLPSISPKETAKLIKDSGRKVVLKTSGSNMQYSVLDAENAVRIAKEISIEQPNCIENCNFGSNGSFSSDLTSSNLTPKFGGGCALNAVQTKNASTSGWDLAFLISFLVPTIIGHIKARANKKKPDYF